LCAFFDNGLREFDRVLRPGGRAVVAEIIWQRENLPNEVVQRWTEGTACVLTLAGNREGAALDGGNGLRVDTRREPRSLPSARVRCDSRRGIP
jgi:ubiquinone/menaquinone biosynthesis C-methylase UbiE